MATALSREDRITFDRLLSRNTDALTEKDRGFLLEVLPSLPFADLLELLQTHGVVGQPRSFVDCLAREWPSAHARFHMNSCVLSVARGLDEDAYADLVSRIVPSMVAGDDNQWVTALYFMQFLRGSPRYVAVAKAIRPEALDPELRALPLRLMDERTDGAACLRRLSELAGRGVAAATDVWELSQAMADPELEAAAAGRALQHLCDLDDQHRVAGRLSECVRRWLAGAGDALQERTDRILEVCERAHASGRSWTELHQSWLLLLPDVHKRLLDRALDDGIVLWGAESRLAPRLQAGRRDAWEILFGFRRQNRPMDIKLLAQMLHGGQPPPDGDATFWTEFAEVWRWAEVQQRQWLSEMTPRLKLQAHLVGNATNFENLPGGFRFLTQDEFFDKLLGTAATAAAARMLVSRLPELDRLARGHVLSDARFALLAPLVDLPHEALPAIEDFRFDQTGLANFRVLHSACAASEMRAYLLEQTGDVERRLGSPTFELALEGDNGTFRAAIMTHIARLPLDELTRVHKTQPKWVPDELLLARVREAPEAVPVADLPEVARSTVVERAERSPIGEVAALVPRLRRDGPERPRLVKILLQRFETDSDPDLAGTLGALLDTRSAWETHGAGLVLRLARARRFDLLELVLYGTPMKIASAPDIKHVGRGASQVVIAIHLALATGLLRWCKELADSGDLGNVAAIIDAMAVLDPPPTFTRELRRLEKHARLDETTRNSLMHLHLITQKEGGTEATMRAVGNCVRHLPGAADV